MNTKRLPKFREDKALAALSKLLEMKGGKADRYWLCKVMYFIERRSLIESGQPMFFGKLFSLPYGPIVSEVNDLLKKSTDLSIPSTWGNYLEIEGNTVKLIAPPDQSCLSQFDEEVIFKEFSEHQEENFNDLSNFSHKLHEYESTDSRKIISYEKILRDTGATEKEIKETIEEIYYLGSLEATLNCAE
jgi:hypothetical protein